MKKIVEEFLKMENELNLYTKTFFNFRYWLYIRVELFEEIQTYINDNGTAFDKTNISLRQIPKMLYRVCFDERYKLEKQKQNDIIFMCHPRRVKSGNQYESIYSDIYANTLEHSITIERPYEGSHLYPAKSKNIYYLDKMYYSRAFYVKIRCKLTRWGDSIENEIRIIIDAIKKRFGFEFEYDKLIKRIYVLYYRYLYTKKYFNRMVNKINPKVIVEVVYYNFETMVLNEIANERKIETIELQHGLTGKYHIAYNYLYDNKLETLPKHMCTFAEFWTENMRMPSKSTILVSTGFAYFNCEMEKYSKKKDCNAIVFLSSGTIGKQMVKLAIALSNIIKKEYKIIFKLHPGEYRKWKERYPELIDSDIRVVDTAETHLYSLFSEAVMQIGAYSTALFEGLGYGLKTCLLRCNELEHVEVLIEKGVAVVVDSAQDIVAALDDEKKQDVSLTYFWKENAYETTRNYIEKLL